MRRTMKVVTSRWNDDEGWVHRYMWKLVLPKIEGGLYPVTSSIRVFTIECSHDAMIS